jgi:DNA-binding response OmpR family regulator
MNPPVLLVEDDVSQSYLIQRALSQLPIALEIVHDGEAALTYLKAYQPALLILDMLLPVRSGMEVLRYVYAAEHLAQMRVLVLSAHDQFRSLELRPGDQFLLKPVEILHIRALVVEMLRASSDTTATR